MDFVKNAKAAPYKLDNVTKEELFQQLFTVGDYSQYMLNKCPKLRTMTNHRLIKCFEYLRLYTGMPLKALEAMVVETPQLLLPRTTDYKYNYETFENIYYANKTCEIPQVNVNHRDVLKELSCLSRQSVEGLLQMSPCILKRSPLDLYVGFMTWRFNTYLPFRTLVSLVRRDPKALFIRREEFLKIRRVYKDKFANKFVDLAHAFVREPRLLYIPLKDIATLFDKLWVGLYISRHDLYKIMLECPTVFTLPYKEIIRKVNYIESFYGISHYHATICFKKCPQIIVYTDKYLIKRLEELKKYNIIYFVFAARPSMLISPESQFAFKFMLTKVIKADSYFANMYGYGISKIFSRMILISKNQGKSFRREDLRLTNNAFEEENGSNDKTAMARFPMLMESLLKIYSEYERIGKNKYWDMPEITRKQFKIMIASIFNAHLPKYYLYRDKSYDTRNFDLKTNVRLLRKLLKTYGLCNEEIRYIFKCCPVIAYIHVKDVIKCFYKMYEFGVDIPDFAFVLMNNPYLLLKGSQCMADRMESTYYRSFFAADPLDVLYTQTYKV